MLCVGSTSAEPPSQAIRPLFWHAAPGGHYTIVLSDRPRRAPAVEAGRTRSPPRRSPRASRTLDRALLVRVPVRIEAKKTSGSITPR